MPSSLRVPVLASVIAAALLSGHAAGAQALPFLLFERYLDPLRIQAGIPGLSALIVQDGQILWERGFGYRDLEGGHAATPDTPYPVADLSQTVTAALLLHCEQSGRLEFSAPIDTWIADADAPGTTIRQLLSHSAPGTALGYRYAPSRFALLATPVERCFEQPLRVVIAREVFTRLAMRDAVPGYDIASAPPAVRDLFDDEIMARYTASLQRMAAPYKVDRRGRAVRGELPPAVVDGAYGLIASARDLYHFDNGLPIYLRADTLATAWTNQLQNGRATPMGLGWFVQTYNGERLVWHFGNFPDAYSSLILKVPSRRLTLILLANSDGLSAPYSLPDGDVTSSLFARTFLRLFL